MASDYIKLPISGKEVGIKFGYTSFKLFQNSIAQFGDQYLVDGRWTDQAIVKIIHCGYLNNCLLKDSAPELDFDGFAEALDKLALTEEGRNKLDEALGVWQNSTYVQRGIKDADRILEEAEKKNLNQ